MEALEQDGQDVLIRIKAVPGSSKDAIRGLLGDRLKVAVAAPPEDGKANAAIIRLIAEALGIRAGDIALQAGQVAPLKTLRIRHIQRADVALALGV